MSNHDWTHENLDAYLAGGLSPEERRDVEQHGAACAECAQVLAESRKLESMMDDLFASTRPDAALEDRAIGRLRKRRVNRASMLRFVAAAAAVLVLGLIGAAVQAIAHAELPFGAVSRGPMAQNNLRAIDDSRSMIAGYVDHGKNYDGRFSVTDADPATPGFDTDINFNVDRIDKVSVPGAAPHNEAVGIVGKKGKEEQFNTPIVPAPYSAFGLQPGEKVLEGRSGASKEHMLGLNYGAFRVEKFTDGSTNTTLNMKVTGAQPGKPAQAGDGLPGRGYAYFQPVKEPAKTPPQAGFLPAGGDKEKGRDKDVSEKGDPKSPKPGPAKIPEPDDSDAGRKIIRTGVMEFEIDSFDSAVDRVNTLISAIRAKGAFVATVNSEKLPNGKVMGSIVVRMPPQLLDKFILDLRRELAKSGQLMSQRIGSQDVTQQNTDLESELRAARAVEERLIEIIKTKKGEIKDLIAAEAELGKWRTKIEKMEGEMRYYNNQISLSTLTITLVEKEILSPFALKVTDHVRMRVEVEEVAKAHQAALKAVEDVKGRVTKSELKQHKAGQLEAILQADIPPEKKDAFREQIKKLGIVTEHEDTQRQEAIGGGGRPGEIKARIDDVHFDLAFNNTANVEPRQTSHLQVAVVDAAAAFARLKDEIIARKGQVRDAKLNEQDKQSITASLEFNVPASEKVAIDKLIAEAGPALARSSTQLPPTDFATERKHGYKLKLFSVGAIPPRETVTLTVEVKDVDKKMTELKDRAIAGKGRVVNADTTRHENGQVVGKLVLDVPIAVQDLLVLQVKDSGNLLSQKTVRDPSVPENELTTARIEVTLNGVFSGKTPRETVKMKLEVADVEKQIADMKAQVINMKGRVADERSGRQANGQTGAFLLFEVPLSAQDSLVQQFKKAGVPVSNDTARNPNVPDNELATGHIAVTLVGATPIVASDEGLWSYVRQSLNFSFKIFAYCILAIITGLSALVPICGLILVGYFLVRWFWPGERTLSSPAKPEVNVAKPADGSDKPA